MKEAIKATAKLYTFHETATRFYKDEWPDRFCQWKKAIEGVMKDHGLSELEAGIKIAEEIKDHGFAVVVMFATVAEMIEPTLKK